MGKLLDKYRSFPVQMKAAFWFLICSFMQKGISLLTTPIFTRLMTTAEYGQFSVFNSWMGILTIFVTLQLSAGVYAQGIVKFESDRDKFSSSFQGLTLTLVLVWTCIYLLFREFWNQLFSLTTPQMLAMLLMMWTTAVFGLWSTEQRVKYNYKSLVVLTIIVSLAKPLLGVFLVMQAENKVLARILGLALVELIAFSGLFVVQIRRGKCFFSAKYWKYALCFNIPLIPHYLSQMVLSSADRIMITNLVGDSEAGIYSLAYSISLIMTLFNNALMNTITPWLYQNIRDNKTEMIGSVSYITLILIAGINIVLIAFAPEAVMIFAPQEYYDAIWVIPPVAMSVFFMYAYDLFAKFQFYFEKSHYIAIASIGGAILNVVLNYIFIPIFGYYAAGYTTLVCYIAYVVAHYLFMKKTCKENLDNVKVFDTKIIVKISGVFLLLGFVFMFTYKYIMVRYSLLIVLFIVVICKRKYILGSLKRVLEIRKDK